jgi:HAD superfamily hydrolase (TIGR01509 family)
MDGTLTRPYLDFDKIRRAVGNTDPNVLTLDFIQSLPAGEQERAFETLRKFEDEAAENAEAQAGAHELLAELRGRGIVTAIFTRNSRRSVNKVLAKLGLKLDRIISREDAPPKPEPDAVLKLMKHYNVGKGEALLVGDFAPDVEAGRRAGIRTALLINHGAKKVDAEPDFKIDSLSQLIEIIDKWPQSDRG